MSNYHALVFVVLAMLNPTTGDRSAPIVWEAFDKPAQNWLPGHRGVDLAAYTGQEIFAAGDGEVIFAGSVAGRPTVSIQHEGFRTTYQPVYASVKKGEVVKKGQRIGRLAPSEEGLHWGAKRPGDDYFDPLTLLDSRRIHLKPWDAPN